MNLTRILSLLALCVCAAVKMHEQLSTGTGTGTGTKATAHTRPSVEKHISQCVHFLLLGCFSSLSAFGLFFFMLPKWISLAIPFCRLICIMDIIFSNMNINSRQRMKKKQRQQWFFLPLFKQDRQKIIYVNSKCDVRFSSAIFFVPATNGSCLPSRFVKLCTLQSNWLTKK